MKKHRTPCEKLTDVVRKEREQLFTSWLKSSQVSGPERRRGFKYVLLSPVCIAAFCQSGERHVIVEGLPEGAKAVGVSWDERQFAFRCLFWHPDWPEVPEGEEIPRHPDVTIHIIEPEGGIATRAPSSQGPTIRSDNAVAFAAALRRLTTEVDRTRTLMEQFGQVEEGE